MSDRPVSRASDDQAQSAPAAVTFDSARAWEHLRRQVAFGPRPAGSAALNETRRYILSQLKAAGIATTEQVFIAKTPLGEMSMGNVDRHHPRQAQRTHHSGESLRHQARS